MSSRVYTLAIHQSLLGQRMANIFHVRSVDPSDPSVFANAIQLLTDLLGTAAQLLSKFAMNQVPDLLYTHGTARCHSEPGRLEYIFAADLAETVGLLEPENDPEPHNLAFPLRLETGAPKHAGRCFISGCSEDQFTATKPNAAGITLVTGLGDYLSAPHVIGGVTYQFVVPQYHLAPDDDDCETPRVRIFDQYNDIVDWSIPPRAWQQGRRRWPVGG